MSQRKTRFCNHSDKIVYNSYVAAMSVASRRGLKPSAYRCSYCGGWHITKRLYKPITASRHNCT